MGHEATKRSIDDLAPAADVTSLFVGFESRAATSSFGRGQHSVRDSKYEGTRMEGPFARPIVRWGKVIMPPTKEQRITSPTLLCTLPTCVQQ